MLPQVSPMLAVAAEPFDAPEYSFEIKYDGVRALAAVDEMGWRLWGRERADYTARYPELDLVRRLPTGTLVDGELVAFDTDGRPHLRRLLRRHALSSPWRGPVAWRSLLRGGVPFGDCLQPLLVPDEDVPIGEILRPHLRLRLGEFGPVERPALADPTAPI